MKSQIAIEINLKQNYEFIEIMQSDIVLI